MIKDTFTVHWRKDGKKYAASFDTKQERNDYMAELKSDPANDVYRFTDFEILA